MPVRKCQVLLSFHLLESGRRETEVKLYACFQERWNIFHGSKTLLHKHL